jgi:hypothetical protein
MDPLSALSIATAVVQFLDFTAAIMSTTGKVYRAAPHTDLERNAHIRSIAEDLGRLNGEVRQVLCASEIRGQMAPSHKEILRIGEACDSHGTRLLEALNSLQKQPKPGSDSTNCWESLRIALRSVWKEQGGVEELFRDVQDYRQQITLQLVVSHR